MCNCGCNASWPFSPAGDPNATQGVGCVTGGGDFTSKPLPCTNYWSPVDLDSRHMPTNANCSDPTKASLAECVGNRTTKITGDDTREIVDIFEDFLRRKAPGGPEEAPFMAVLWLHTNHEPHPVRDHLAGQGARQCCIISSLVVRVHVLYPHLTSACSVVSSPYLSLGKYFMISLCLALGLHFVPCTCTLVPRIAACPPRVGSTIFILLSFDLFICAGDARMVQCVHRC